MLRVLLLMAVAAVMAVACGVEQGETPNPAPSNPTATATAEVEPDGPYTRLLARIPDTEETRWSVSMTDMAAVRDLAGVDRPGDEADADDMMDYLVALHTAVSDRGGRGLGFEGWLSGMHQEQLSSGVSPRPYLAFDARDVDQVVEYGAAPGRVELIHGNYAPEATDSALESCDECEEHETVEHAGEMFYVWNEDAEGQVAKRRAPPAFDEVGRGGQVHVGEGFVSRTLSNDKMKLLIDTAVGNKPSLADSEDYLLAANVLEDSETVTAIFSSVDYSTANLLQMLGSRFSSHDSITQTEIEAQMSAGPLLLPFNMLASGMGFSDDDVFTTLVIVHDTEADAAENAGRLEQRIESAEMPLWQVMARPPDGESEPVYWRDRLDDYEITAEGRTVIARLQGAGNMDLTLLPSGFFGGVLIPLTVHE
ncbi:MAG: hypothetical protein WD208_06515 [Dehalococcoidia bacterium]